MTPHLTDHDDEDEEYDLPTMDSTPYQESYFELNEDMVSEGGAEPEPESTQILMNIYGECFCP